MRQSGTATRGRQQFRWSPGAPRRRRRRYPLQPGPPVQPRGPGPGPGSARPARLTASWAAPLPSPKMAVAAAQLRYRPAGGALPAGPCARRGRGGSSAPRPRPRRGPWARREAAAAAPVPCGCRGCTATRRSSRPTGRGAWPAPPRSTTASQVRAGPARRGGRRGEGVTVNVRSRRRLLTGPRSLAAGNLGVRNHSPCP